MISFQLILRESLANLRFSGLISIISIRIWRKIAEKGIDFDQIWKKMKHKWITQRIY